MGMGGGQKFKMIPGIYTIRAELFRTTPDGNNPKVGESNSIELEIVNE